MERKLSIVMVIVVSIMLSLAPVIQPIEAVDRKEITLEILNAKITNEKGEAIGSANQYTVIKFALDFKIPNNIGKKGDYTNIKLPDALKFEGNNKFEMKDSLGNIVAYATVNPLTKTAELVYTDYIEKNSNISGSLEFFTRIDTTTTQVGETVQIDIDINGEVISGGTIEIEHNSDDPNEKFSKYNWFLNEEGTQIQNILRINPSGGTFNAAVVYDELRTAGLDYELSSFKILKGDWILDAQGVWRMDNGVDVTADFEIKFGDDNRSFSIDFGKILNSDEYMVQYITSISYQPVTDEKFENYAKLEDTDVIIKEVVRNTVYYSAGGGANGYNHGIKLLKVDAQGNPLEGATFTLTRNRTNQIVATSTSDVNGVVSFADLLKDDYTLEETVAPDGYLLLESPIAIPNDLLIANGVFELTVENEKIVPPVELISISGTKTWVDGESPLRPEAITVRLFADGTEVTNVTPIWTKAGDVWTYTFKDVPKTHEGENITYTVTEDAVPGYQTTQTGLDITNTKIEPPIELISISGTKTWDDGQSSQRPEAITVRLYADGTEVTNVTPTWVKVGDVWSYTFKGLPKMNGTQTIIYTVSEDTVPGYETNIADFNITNTLVKPPHELISIQGTKTWVDQSNQSGQRPHAITVRLYADGKEVQNVKPVWSKADDVWYYEFANLPKFAGDRSIEYSVREDAVAGYITRIEGFNITNTLNPKPVLPETGLADNNYGWILIVGGFAMMLTSRMKRRPKH